MSNEQRIRDIYNRDTVEWIYKAVLRRGEKIQIHKQSNNKYWEIREIGCVYATNMLRVS